jgi:hypothetical protein
MRQDIVMVIKQRHQVGRHFWHLQGVLVDPDDEAAARGSGRGWVSPHRCPVEGPPEGRSHLSQRRRWD